jgi:hypothetical protein
MKTVHNSVGEVITRLTASYNGTNIARMTFMKRLQPNMNGLVLTESLKDQTKNQRRIDGSSMGEWLCGGRLVFKDLWMGDNGDIAQV